MKREPKLKDIPVVMISADGQGESVAEFLRNGAETYLLKPVKANLLMSLKDYVKLPKIKKTNSSKAEYQFIKEVYINYFLFFILFKHYVLVGQGRGWHGAFG